MHTYEIEFDDEDLTALTVVCDRIELWGEGEGALLKFCTEGGKRLKAAVPVSQILNVIEKE